MAFPPNSFRISETAVFQKPARPSYPAEANRARATGARTPRPSCKWVPLGPIWLSLRARSGLDDPGECTLTTHDLRECTGRMDVEHDDGQVVFPREADRSGIHDAKVLRENVVIGQLLIARGIRELAWIGGIDAIHLGALQQRVALHFRRAQRGS